MNRTHAAYAASVACALIGGGLLLAPQQHGPAQRAASSTTAAATTTPSLGTAGTPSAAPPAPLSPASASAARTVRAVAASSSPVQTTPSGALAPGDGPAADATVQQLLEESSPRNLPAPLETQLAHLAAQVWLADVTGQGRDHWPTYFTQPGNSGYTHTRIQAAIARTTGPGRVTATVLWAGTSPTGDAQIGLTGTIHLREQPDHLWEPTR